MRHLALVAIGFVMFSGHAMAEGTLCGEGQARALVLEGKTATVAVAPAGKGIPVSESFSLEIQICDAPEGTEVVRMDARMPAHGHGMTYRPDLKQRENGRYVAENVLLHMPGTWEFIIDTRGPDQSERLRAETVVGP